MSRPRGRSGRHVAPLLRGDRAHVVGSHAVGIILEIFPGASASQPAVAILLREDCRMRWAGRLAELEPAT